MLISPIKFINPEYKHNACYNKIRYSNISLAENCTVFKGKAGINQYSVKYLRAKEYLKLFKASHKDWNKVEIYNFDLNKLDGIQEGLKVFNGLNMKEIAFIGQTIIEIALKRGCYNNCSHCYGGGSLPIIEDNNHINKMSWNDFNALTEGFRLLNKRLGFPITRNSKNVSPYMTSFHDADGIDIYLVDNNGKEHDFIEISEKLNEAFKLKNIFDTAGWGMQDSRAAARAVKYAMYYSKPENARKLLQFNLSVNPYHMLNTRAVHLDKQGEHERAQKIRNIYTSRMANVLFTFTPLIESGKLNFLARAASDDSLGTKGFREKDLRKLYDEIFNKLKLKYMEDYIGEQIFIKDKTQIRDLIAQAKLKLSYVNTLLGVTERLGKIYKPGEALVTTAETIRQEDRNKIKQAKCIKDVLLGNDGYIKFTGFLDSNGHYYLTDFFTTFPTEIVLNFENKNKITAPIAPYLQKDLIIKKRLINSI